MRKSNYTWKDKIKAIGPGAVITASFIGPGTVTASTKAGADFGYTLLWTVLFATFATIILQEMSARLGIITRSGLGEAIANTFKNKNIKKISEVIVGFSIVSGCAAYIAGDLAGTALGFTTVFGGKNNVVAPLIGIFVLILVYKGSFHLLEKLLTTLVVFMVIVFVITMIIVKPDISSVFSGLFTPKINNNNLFMIIALVGTTIVPYNFFIHAASASKTWKTPEELELSKWDIYFSIVTGGVITAAILITSAVTMNGVLVKTASDLAIQLEPLLGKFAKVFLGIGIFSAGLSSAIASPLGASYTLAGLYGWKYDNSDRRFKITNLIIVIIGIFGSATGFNPISLILVSQVLNGIILPVVVVYLVYATSREDLLGEYKNTTFQNIAGILIAGISFILGGSSLIPAFKSILSRF